MREHATSRAAVKHAGDPSRRSLASRGPAADRATALDQRRAIVKLARRGFDRLCAASVARSVTR
jgi:hypothetical protein